MNVFAAIRSDSRLEELIRLLTAEKRGAVTAEGLWGSFAPILAGLVAEKLRRPLLLVTAHADAADDCRDDVETVIGTAPELLPQLDTVSGESFDSDELAGERLRLCMMLLGELVRSSSATEASGGVTTARAEARGSSSETSYSNMRGSHIVAPVMALMQPVPSAEAIEAQSLTIETGLTLEPEALARWLNEHGFGRCDAVDVPGDFAQRGGIIDVYSNANVDPVRIEFFGDEIESIRLFDLGTQRSSHELHSVRIPARSLPGLQPAGCPTPSRGGGRTRIPCVAAAPRGGREISGVARTSTVATGGGRYIHQSPTLREGGAPITEDLRKGQMTSFLALLPKDTIIAFNEPTEIQELGRTIWQRLGEPAGMITVDALFRRANDFTQLHLQRFGGVTPQVVKLGANSLPQFEPKSADAIQALCELSGDNDVFVLCDNTAEEQRFVELLNDLPQRPPRLRTAVGVIHRGFRWGKVAYVPHHELFHRYRQRRTLRRVQPARPIDSFFDLEAGDLVVHSLYGIGRFLGLKTLDRQGQRGEYLAIEFADKAVVHVASSQIHIVQKYIGTFRGKPRLSKLGGTTWKKTKARVAEAVTDLAAEMLVIQAERATRPGSAYPQDTTWQREFEDAFIFTETEDQLRALDEVKADMTRPQPMDRLLCGDVGYGKTELAMRAAFKTVEYGKQVAVLVPTTVLAQQHYQTFRERMADYPFVIEVLSRFRGKSEQSKIVEQARKGQVDILIGTHRLLSADVRFADLGLVIIDEEQRFGVDAKERLKRLRSTVEVLTLSATPIPRTLHMAMLGIRDISSLATPPLDRRAIVTQVRMWDDELIREAILRELNRDGQVYFVHNFVRDIHNIANRLRGIVPEACFVVGHGQMPGHELEDVMLRFLNRQADVLVSTNIIESGLDIPSTNTIFINRAERFGLADLHQLRGRVGRSKHRAYAYLLLSPKHPVKNAAARRLKAIEQYSELGAGFQIAMRDLEIRGAGNILGSEQSGHIEAVGYEMYCQLLEQAVRRMRNEPAELFKPVNLELGLSASIPRTYIRSDRQRMEVYKRLTSCHTPQELTVLHDDLRDAFGQPPEEVQTLLTLAELRVLARPWGIRSIVLDAPDLIFAVEDFHQARPLFETGPGSPRVPDPKTIHWRLPKRFLELPTLLTILRRQLAGETTQSPPSQPVHTT